MESKIRKEYKEVLNAFYLPEPPDDAPFDTLTIEYRIVRHNRRKLDSDNAIFAIKYLSDVLEANGWIADDTNTQFHSFPKVVDTNLPETMLDIRIKSGTSEWKKTRQRKENEQDKS